MRFAQAMIRLVTRAIQQFEAMLLRARSGSIGIAAVQPQFNAGATSGFCEGIGEQCMLVIGMIGMHHPVAAVASQNQQIFILMQNFCLQHIALEN
jgi:hypothetical protein